MGNLDIELDYYRRKPYELLRNEEFIIDLYGVDGFNYLKDIIRPQVKKYIEPKKQRFAKPPKSKFKCYSTPLRCYRKEVRRLTELQPLHLLEGFNDRGFFGLHVDHIISIVDAFNLGWTPEQCAHISNLQMLTHKENGLKVHKSYCKLPRQIILSS